MMETHCNKIDLSEALQKDVSQWSMRFASNFQKSAGASNAPFFRIESSCREMFISLKCIYILIKLSK